jgi:hypothetical protein
MLMAHIGIVCATTLEKAEANRHQGAALGKGSPLFLFCVRIVVLRASWPWRAHVIRVVAARWFASRNPSYMCHRKALRA